MSDDKIKYTRVDSFVDPIPLPRTVTVRGEDTETGETVEVTRTTKKKAIDEIKKQLGDR